MRADEPQCKTLASALWLRVADRHFCVRYWIGWPDKASPAEALAVFFGDIGRRRQGKFELHEAAARLTDAEVQRHVEAVSRLSGGVSFILGRPGTFGSSGNHLRDRRTPIEVRVMAAALDVLKARYGVKRFHLAGQSGGGHTVAALAQTRGDLGCAVVASGSVSLVAMQRDAGFPIFGKHSLYNPLDHVRSMRRRPDLRLIVVSDPDDKVVSYRSQREFVERVRARGLPIMHITAAAAVADKNAHDLHLQGLRVAAACAKGIDDGALVARYQNKTIETPSVPAEPARRDAQRASTPAPTPASAPAPTSHSTAVERTIDSPVRPRPSRPAVAPWVLLYEEEPSNPAANRHIGSARWRTETISPGRGQASDLAIRVDVEIPGRRLAMTMSIRRNTDPGLPATHTIEILFNLPADFAFGGVASVPGLLMKEAEQMRGAPLSGLAVKVTSNFFLIGLSAVEADVQGNLTLLKERSWFDIPVVYNNGRRGIIAIEKGPAGSAAIENAFARWERASAASETPGPAAAGERIPRPGGLGNLFSRQPITVAPPANDPAQGKPVSTPAVQTTAPQDNSADDAWRQWDQHGRVEMLKGLMKLHSGVETHAPPAAKPAGYVARLSSNSSEAEAETAFKTLRARYPEVLGNRQALITRVKRGEDVFYRAQVGPFESAAQANALCDELKAAGGQCVVDAAQ